MQILPKKMVGIEFHDYSAEIVEIKLSKGVFQLESYHRLPMPSGIITNGEIKNENELKQIITELFNKANPKAIQTKHVATLFPSNKVFTHIFKFPVNLSEKELYKAIPYEAESIIPYSIDEIYWDFNIIMKEDVKKPHASQYIMFAAIQKDVADRYAKVFNAVNLIPEQFAINVEALRYALAKQLENKKGCLIIDFSSLSTNYLIVSNGQIQYFLSANEGGSKLLAQLTKEYQVPTDAIIEKKRENKLKELYNPLIKDFLGRRFTQAQNLINQYSHINSVALTGEFLNLPNMVETAQNYFVNQEVLVGDPKLEIEINASKFIPQQNEPIPYSTYFTNPIGIALYALKKSKLKKLNLLPQPLKDSMHGQKMNLLMGLGALMLCVFSVGMAIFISLKQQDLSYERRLLEIKKSAIEKTVYGSRYQEIRSNIIAFNQELSILSQIDNNLFSIPQMMDQIWEKIPANITPNEIYFNDDSLTFSLTGIAANRESLLTLQEELESLDFVTEVISPLSNFDEKTQISFILELILSFSELPSK